MVGSFLLRRAYRYDRTSYMWLIPERLSVPPSPLSDYDLNQSVRWTQQVMDCLEQPALSPPMLPNGRVAMPGVNQGLPISEYRRLALLFQNIRQADQLLQSYRAELGLTDVPLLANWWAFIINGKT
jgi:hypothetical protein